LEIEGSQPLLLAFIVLFVAGAQGLGLLISSVTTSQQVAFQAASFATLLPTLLLSGFIFPIRSMPLVVQAFTYLLPGRYFVTVLRGIVLKGVGLGELWREAVALGIFAAATLTLSALRLKRGRL
ncbi:MAG: ABC transporter permease, partial [Myxococcaceae bacterium]